MAVRTWLLMMVFLKSSLPVISCTLASAVCSSNTSSVTAANARRITGSGDAIQSGWVGKPARSFQSTQ